MSTTQLAVANMALAHLAIGKSIAAMDEANQPARTMTQFYAQARDETLRAFDWPFATKFATLATVAGPTPRASVDYLYSYTYPSDCIRARRLRNQPRRPDVRVARVPFIVTQGLILTDVEPIDATTEFPAFPQLEYTVVVAETLWPSDFAQALARLLAWYGAPTLTAGDPHKLGQRSLGEYDRLVRSAWNSNMNEREEDIDEPECSFLTARD